MTLQYGDRVQETFTTTGTGAVSLAGAVVGYQAFASVCGNADICYYAATDGTNWEVGIGTYTSSGDTLTRTTVLSSSNGGAAVNWAAGTKNIWLTLPAAQVAQSFLGMRNRLLNGDMRIDQRNAGGSQTITTSAVFALDRWIANTAGANATGQRVAGSGADQYHYQFTGAASITSIEMLQRIESTNIYDLAGQTVTLSAELADSALTTVTWAAYFPTASDNYTTSTQIATGTFTVNATLAKYSASFALPSGVQNGLMIVLSVAAQVSGTFTLGNIQLEAGSIATPFERRPISYELAQCQRYYQKSWNQGVVPGTTFTAGAGSIILNGASASIGGLYFSSRFPVSMRIAPTVTIYDAAGSSGKYSFLNGSGWNNAGNAPVNLPFEDGVNLGASSGVQAVNLEYTANAEI